MNNVVTIGGYQAVIAYDPDLQMFRGEFTGLNGGADFYAKDVKGLAREGKASIKIFVEACKEDGVDPRWRRSRGLPSGKIPAAGRQLSEQGRVILKTHRDHVQDISLPLQLPPHAQQA